MAVASRYVSRELIAVFVVTLGLLLLVAVGGRFIGYLQEAAIGKLSGATVLVIMFYRLPEFVQLIAPFAIYVAILLTVSRLYADREMVVLQGAGAGTGRLLGWLTYTLLAVVAFVAVLTTVVTPLAKQALETYLAEQRARSQFDTVNPGVFHIAGYRLTYSEKVSDDRTTLYEVFLAEGLNRDRRVTIWAESAQQRLDETTGSRFLVLRNGYRYDGGIGQSDYQVLEFEELRQRLDQLELASELDVAATPTLALRAPGAELAELHWRIGLPVFALVGGLLALGLAQVKPRQGRFAKVAPAMLTVLLYYLFLLVNHNALTEETWPPGLGLWVVHALFLAFAIVLLRRLGRPVSA